MFINDIKNILESYTNIPVYYPDDNITDVNPFIFGILEHSKTRFEDNVYFFTYELSYYLPLGEALFNFEEAIQNLIIAIGNIIYHKIGAKILEINNYRTEEQDIRVKIISFTFEVIQRDDYLINKDIFSIDATINNYINNFRDKIGI